MRARRSWWLGIAVGILLAAPVVAAKAEERFNAAYNAKEECSDATDSDGCERRAAAAAGREIDRFVLTQLRAGRSAEAINKALAKLNGYLPASTGKGVQMSCATFWSEPPRAAPTYVVAPLPGGPVERLLGVFNFSSVLFSGPGRLSLFIRKEGGWQRTAGLDSSFTLSAACLGSKDECRTLVVMETFLGADRSELSVSTWKVGAERLTREARHWDDLWDADVERIPSGLRITYASMPDFIPEPVLGARLLYQLDLTQGSAATEARLTDLAPWLSAADRAYGMAEGRLKAAPVVKGAGIEKLHGHTSTVEHARGDLKTGRGFVALRDAFDETTLWCLDVNRRADGVWRVQNVKKTKTCGGQRRRKVD